MAKSNVTQFAEELKLPVTLLLEQLQAAGVKKKAGEDAITEQDKTRLLDYLREMPGNKEGKKRSAPRSGESRSRPRRRSSTKSKRASAKPRPSARPSSPRARPPTPRRAPS